MDTNIILTGSQYFQVIQPNENIAYELIPFDLNGNVFKQVTIEVDNTDANCFILLPNIKTLNANYDISINIISLNSTTTGNFVYISPQNDDLIGNQPQIQLTQTGSNVILTPIGATNWNGIVCEGSVAVA